MHVDEPGATTSPRASMIRRAAHPAGEPTDRRDPVAADRHVALEPGVAGSVDDLAAADHQIERFFGLPAGEVSRATQPTAARSKNRERAIHMVECTSWHGRHE